MKWGITKVWKSILIACILVQNAQALTINGAGTLKNQAIDGDVVINGAGDIDNTTISGGLQVNGAVSMKNSKAGNLVINGSFSGEKVSVAAKTHIQGGVSAKDSVFEDVEINAQKATFENCSAKEIIVSKMNNKDQIIQIIGASKIQKITFESNGVIKKSSQSTIDVVQGATIENY